MPPKKSVPVDIPPVKKARGRPKKVVIDPDADVPDVPVPSKAPAKKSRKPSPWNDHVNKVYKAGKKKDSAYKYSQAMKDAKSSYKKA